MQPIRAKMPENAGRALYLIELVGVSGRRAAISAL